MAGRGAIEESGLADRAALLTREFVHRFWDGDTEWCSKLVAPDGAGVPFDGEEPAAGPEGFRIAHERLTALRPRVILINETYHAMKIDDAVLCVAGTCTAFLGSKKEEMEQLAFRVTLVWRWTRSAMRLVQYHFSTSPLHAQDGKGEAEPDTQVRELFQSTAKNDTRNLVLRDEKGITHFLNGNDVRYFEAYGRKAVAHLRSGSICVCRGIGALEQEAGDAFVRVHRSYLVNAHTVESVSYKGCVLNDGTVLPVPGRRLAEIKMEIAQARKLDAQPEDAEAQAERTV